MMYYMEHSGVKGQKWGIRRYQNPDGSLTPEGKKRYGSKKKLEEHIQKVNKRKQVAKKAVKWTFSAASIGAYAYVSYHPGLALRVPFIRGLIKTQLMGKYAGLIERGVPAARIEREIDTALDKVQIMTLPEMLKEVFGG